MNEGAAGELNRTLMNRSSAAAPSAMRAGRLAAVLRAMRAYRCADGSPRLRRRRGRPCMQALSWITPSVGPL